MPFSDILKILPKLDEKDLKAMERNLQTRFTKIAKGFGKGLLNVLKGGGVLGAAFALIDKILNPLKEVQESIDRILKTSDDLATNASQFNTTTGKLAKLVTLAKATGLEPDNLYMLITKFQTAVADAQQNPLNPYAPAVKNFTDQADTADAFFSFIQSLQKMDKNQQLLVQEAVFGQKQILKMADFLQQDFAKLAEATGINKVSSTDASKTIEGAAALSDLNDIFTASREFKDLLKKSSLVNEGMIRARDKSERIALEKENQRIRSYEDLRAISDTAEKIMTLVESGVAMLGKLINVVTPKINRLVELVEKFSQGPAARGVLKFFGKGD